MTAWRDNVHTVHFIAMPIHSARNNHRFVFCPQGDTCACVAIVDDSNNAGDCGDKKSCIHFIPPVYLYSVLNGV
jgi:hypothetical protein